MKYLRRYNEAIKLHSTDELNKKLQEFKEILSLELEDVINIYDIMWDQKHITQIDNSYSNDFGIRFKITGDHSNEEISKAINDWVVYVEGENDWGNFPGNTNKSEKVAEKLRAKAIEMYYNSMKPRLDKISRKYDIRIQFRMDDISLIYNNTWHFIFDSIFMIYYNKKTAKFKE